MPDIIFSQHALYQLKDRVTSEDEEGYDEKRNDYGSINRGIGLCRDQCRRRQHYPY